jgi:hypothetical protein
LEKTCWLWRGVRWRLTCASKCLAIMVFKKKSVPVIFEPPCTCFLKSGITCCVSGSFVGFTVILEQDTDEST